jgi:hypothetical protein
MMRTELLALLQQMCSRKPSRPLSGPVYDDGNNQQVNCDAFDLFYYSMRKRMFGSVLLW